MSLDISTSYLGMKLQSPIVVGSCPLVLNPEMVRQLSIAGAGAIVLPSLFEEQIVHQRKECGEDVSEEEAMIEWMCYGKVEGRYNGGPQAYLDAIASLKSVAVIPIIANLNGCTSGHWIHFAREIQLAGADAIEIMIESEIYDPSCSADEVERRLLDSVVTLCDEIEIPISVKLSQFHTNLPNLAWRLLEAGVTGIVCFAHDPVWNVCTERIKTSPKWELTHCSNINPTIAGLIRVRSGCPTISLAASGGVCSPLDFTKVLIAGADVAMVTSEVYRSGSEAITTLFSGLQTFLEDHSFESFGAFLESRPTPSRSLRGASLQSLTRPKRYEDPTPRLPFGNSGDRWGHLHGKITP